MKKFLAVLLVVVFVLSLLCSCADEKDDGINQSNLDGNAKPITVFIAGWDSTYEGMERLIRTAAQIFTETYGIEVELYPSLDEDAVIAGEDMSLYRDKLFAEIMAGKGPDVFISGSANIFTDLYKKMDSGAFCDLNEFIENDPDFDLSEYEERILDVGIYKGCRYILPISYEIPTLVTSGKKLESAGLTAEDFSTYDRFLSTWENIQQNKDANIRLMNMKESWGSFVYSCGWLTECVDFESGTTNFDLSAFKRVAELFKTEHHLEEYGVAGGGQAFEEGKIYTDRLFTYQTFVGDFTTRPDIYGVGVDDMMVIPIPNSEGDCVATIQDFCMISSTTKNPDASWLFVKTLLSDEVQLETMDRLFGVTVKTKYVDAAIDTQFSDPRNDNPYDDAFIDQVKARYHSYDSVALPAGDGQFWSKIIEYAESEDQTFDEFKAEIENFYKIFMSE